MDLQGSLQQEGMGQGSEGGSRTHDNYVYEQMRDK